MLVDPAGHWSIYTQIFFDHWESFQRAHPRYQTASYDGLVAKMLGCGAPEQMGYVEHRCQQCGLGKHVVSMSCKSSLCLRCAKVLVDNWVSQVSRVLHEGVISRPLILTGPAMFRPLFSQNAAELVHALMQCGARCLDDLYSERQGKALKGGSITVIHTHGRTGQYHPHVHLIATSGGDDGVAERWEHGRFVPYDLLHRTWQWHLRDAWRKTLATEEMKRRGDECCRRYRNGLVANVQKGRVPAQYHSLASYVAKDVVSPPIAVRRIARSDGQWVTYHYRSHRTDRTERETVDVKTFIGRMIQHTMPQGFKRIRYYGVQATKTFAKVKVAMQAALAKVEEVVTGAVKIIARLSYRQRYAKSTGRDPLICSHCGGEMGVWRMWHPRYGVIDDEAQVIKRGTYGSNVQQSGP